MGIAVCDDELRYPETVSAMLPARGERTGGEHLHLRRCLFAVAAGI